MVTNYEYSESNLSREEMITKTKAFKAFIAALPEDTAIQAIIVYEDKKNLCSQIFNNGTLRQSLNARFLFSRALTTFDNFLKEWVDSNE